MNPQEPLQLLIDDLIELYQKTGSPSKLPPESRPGIQEFVERLLVNRDALCAHIRLLQQRLPRPHRHAHFLPEEQTETVVNSGLRVLDDDALAALVLNPVALSGLYDEIDERLPAAWLDAMHEDGVALLKAHGRTVPHFASLVGPVGGEVKAALPTDDTVLAHLVHEALQDAQARVGLQSTNREILKEVQRQLVGRARLDPTDRLRFLEMAAKELQQIQLLHVPVASDTAAPETVLSATEAVKADTETPQHKAVEEQAARLAKLDNPEDEHDRLNALIRRLSELGLEANEIGDLLGLQEEEVEVRLAYAEHKGEPIAPKRES